MLNEQGIGFMAGRKKRILVVTEESSIYHTMAGLEQPEQETIS